jgi:hypothetical protein
MVKRRVSFRLDSGEYEALKTIAKDHRSTFSAAGRELIRQGLGMSGRGELQAFARQLKIIEKRSRRAQIGAYRTYAGIVELIRFIAKDDNVVREVLETLVEKSSETLRKEEERGDYK